MKYLRKTILVGAILGAHIGALCLMSGVSTLHSAIIMAGFCSFFVIMTNASRS